MLGTGEGRVNHLHCQNSPPLDVWVNELLKLDSDFGIDEKHKPDKDWCVAALATFCPQHHFFKLGFRYAPNKFSMVLNEMKFVDNSHGLINSVWKSKAKKSTVKLELLKGQMSKE